MIQHSQFIWKVCFWNFSTLHFTYLKHANHEKSWVKILIIRQNNANIACLPENWIPTSHARFSVNKDSSHWYFFFLFVCFWHKLYGSPAETPWQFQPGSITLLNSTLCYISSKNQVVFQTQIMSNLSRLTWLYLTGMLCTLYVAWQEEALYFTDRVHISCDVTYYCLSKRHQKKL